MTNAGIGPAASGRTATLEIVVEHVAERGTRKPVCSPADGNQIPVYRLVWLLGQVKAVEQTHAVIVVEVLMEDGSPDDGAVNSEVITHDNTP